MRAKKLMTLGIFFFVMVLFAKAQNPGTPLAEALKSYATTNIKPVMKIQRQKLESELSPQEKAEIDSLRSQLRVIRQKRTDSKITFQDRMKGTKPNESQQAVLSVGRKQIRKVMMRAVSIADAHETLIDQISADTKLQHAKWRQDIKAIVLKYKGDNAALLVRQIENFGAGDSIRPALFVLWDPESKY